jgi:hypothetical protein
MSPGPGNLVWFVAFGLGEIGYVNASKPIPISMSSVNSVELEQGGSLMVRALVQKPVSDSVYLGVSANSHDAPIGLSPLLYGTANQRQTGPGSTAVSASFRISAAWNLGLGDRYLALTAYTSNVAVNVFVRVDLFQTRAPYLSAGLASSAVIGSVVLYWRYLPKASKKSQNAKTEN